jgi:DNA processing protein
MKNLVLHLSLIEGIGPAVVTKIFQNASLLEQLYSFDASDFVTHYGFSQIIAQRLVAGLANKKVLEQELLLIQKHAITVHTFLDDEYPALLRQIYLPPPVLYCKGFLKNNKALAVVGSRKAQSYAQRVINLLLPPLIDNGWTVVSGGALGADTFAHYAAVKQGRETIVVLGSGLLKQYPTQNKKLFDEVVQTGGALVSPFALLQEPLPGNFPARNRIIAGLSQGCLVVQAAQKSGASITARYALDQGKDVFVVPGHIDDPLSAGCHILIQQGAKLVMTASDILSEFNELALSSEMNVEKYNHIVPVQENHEDPFLVLCKNPISIEDLAEQTDLSFVELQQKLFDLQLEGKISQNFAGLWHCSSNY